MDKIFKYKFQLLSFLIIVIAFHLCYGISIVVPSNINWLMSAYHDWGAHYLGWANFQHETWHFPLGHIDNYSYPAGTNIGFTDSIPLFAIFFKIFSFLLPDTFQYFGIWLFLCHLLAGYFTYRILKRYTSNYLLLILSILLVSFSPVLIYRMLHPALCAHWVLIASIYYYTKKANKENVYSINRSQIVVLVLSALINPYLFLMVIGFNLILPFKHYFFDHLITLKRGLIYVIIPIIITLFCWYIIGMISFDLNDNSMEVQNAYGLYGLNLNSLYNSSGFSSFFSQLPSYTVQQYEGYAYLGLGVFILIAISLIYLAIQLVSLKRKPTRNFFWLLPLALLITLLTLFAISNKVSLNDQLLFEFSLPHFILKIGNVFRASGRFIWVLYYSIYLFALFCFLKFKVAEIIKIVVLLLIVSLQFYDIKLFMTAKDYPYGDYHPKPLDEKKWLSISSNFERMVTYPPFENSLVYALDYQDLCYIALKNELPITCGYVARNSGNGNEEFKQQIQLEVNNGVISPTDLFIIAPDYLKDFNALIYKKKVSFGFLDGYYYLYSKENNRMHQHEFDSVEKNKIDSINNVLASTNKLKPIEKPNVATGQIQFNIEKNTINNDILSIEGWAFLKDGKAKLEDSIFIVLESFNKTYLAQTLITERPDLIQHFENDNLKNAGFKATIFTEDLENTEYNLLIGIKSNEGWIFESLNQPAVTLDKEFPPQKLSELPYESQKEIVYNVEETKEELENIYINGWAFLSNQTSLNSTIEVILENDKGSSYTIKTLSKQRPDVTSYFKSDYNYDNAGFTAKVKKESLTNGIYKIGILITNSLKSKDYKLTDKTLEIKN